MSNTASTSQPQPEGQSGIHGQLPPPPPPLPPLPQRYGQRAATAIAKLAHPWLVTHPARPSDAHTRPEDPNADQILRPESSRYHSHAQISSSSVSSRSAAHKTGIPIAALDVSPARTHAVLAGREILKTVRIASSGKITEEVNIRSSIIAYASAHSSSRVAVSARHRDQLAANDVKWSNGNYDTFIATAAASGRIVIYDLNRAALELTTLIEHARQVHKLAFNPFKGEVLLSGSQDGGIKLWDIRSATSSRRSQATFNAHDQGIRDVRWSTTDGVEFATGTEGGVVQRWDIRRPNAPLVKLKAHDKTCHSIDYHPTGKYLASAGADRTVKVWSTTKTDKRQTSKWTIQTPQHVLNARWRPAAIGDTDRDNTSTAYIVTTYDKDPRIHVWDFHRPSIPYQEIDRYDTPASDVLWHSENLLWTVGSLGMFTQTDFCFVPKPLRKLNVNTVAVAPDGHIALFSNPKEKERRRPVTETSDLVLVRVDTGGSSGEVFGSSLSAEGSYDESGVLASTLGQRRQKAASQRLMTGLSRNSDDAAFGRTEAAVNLDPSFESGQFSAHGHVQGIGDSAAFKYLAEHYEPPVDVQDCPDIEAAAAKLESVFVKNSTHAEHAGDHGLAHVWKILAWAVKKELEDWSRTPASKKPLLGAYRSLARHEDAVGTADMTRTTSESTSRDHVRFKTSLPSAAHDSGSNVPTPRVRPAAGDSSVPPLPPGSLGDEFVAQAVPALAIQPPKSLHTSLSPRADLGTSDHSKPDSTNRDPNEANSSARPVAVPIAVSGEGDREQTDSNGSVPSFSDFEEQLAVKRAALSEYRQTPRPILKFGDTVAGRTASPIPVPQSPTLARTGNRPGLDRYDSGESFNMLSESLGSHQTSLPMSSFEESPVKPTADKEYRDKLEKELIEDRLLVPELGKQAAAEEGGRLLEEIMNSQDQAHGFSDPKSALTEPSPDSNSAARPDPRTKAEICREDIQSSFDAPGGDDKLSKKTKDMGCSGVLRYAVDLDRADVKPWHASSFLRALLSQHLSQFSVVQLPAFLALYLHPIYPTIFPTGSLLSLAPSIRHEHSLNRRHLSAVVLSYHSQLVAQQHFVAAAKLRTYCAATFPEVSLQAAPGSLGGWWCRVCGKKSKGAANRICARCATPWGGCMVCGKKKLTKRRHEKIERNLQELATARNDHGDFIGVIASMRPDVPRRKSYPERQSMDTEARTRPKSLLSKQLAPTETSSRPSTVADRGARSQSRYRNSSTSKRSTQGGRWTYCNTCGHGGHASCLAAWFVSRLSGGSCAVPGCKHPCAPGPSRDEQRAAQAREKSELSQLRRGQGVLKDDRVARESKAVSETRGSAGEGMLIPQKDAPGTVWPPMESVRDGDAFEGADRLGIGMGIGRGRGRWRNSRDSGSKIIGSSGGTTADRKAGRTSIGSSMGAGSEVGILKAEGSLEANTAGVGGAILAASSAAAAGAGSGPGFGPGVGSGAPVPQRRVRLVEPGRRDAEDEELAIEFVETSTTSSSVP